ncbi:MAG TPA: hypothetical protein VFX59_23805 [Polyangiales bacterium]|nr:hypothetical protein [Polyangiales bacterium]
MRLWWLFALALPCTAQAQSVHLKWSAPVGSMCPNGATLSADVEQLTGQRFVSDPEAAEVRLVGRIERAELGVAAQIEAHTADGTPIGTRELRAGSDDCASLRRPLAMVLALLLEQPIPTRRHIPFGLGVELAGNTHLMPRTTGGVGLLALIAPASWLRIRMQSHYWWPVLAETARGSGAQLQAVDGAFSLCPRLGGGSQLALWLCVGAQAGGVFASARGLSQSASKTLPFADLLTELVGSWRAGKLGVWASGGPLFALSRPQLYFERADTVQVAVHRASPVGAIFRVAMTTGGQ